MSSRLRRLRANVRGDESSLHRPRSYGAVGGALRTTNRRPVLMLPICRPMRACPLGTRLGAWHALACRKHIIQTITSLHRISERSVTGKLPG